LIKLSHSVTRIHCLRFARCSVYWDSARVHLRQSCNLWRVPSLAYKPTYVCGVVRRWRDIRIAYMTPRVRSLTDNLPPSTSRACRVYETGSVGFHSSTTQLACRQYSAVPSLRPLHRGLIIRGHNPASRPAVLPHYILIDRRVRCVACSPRPEIGNVS